MSSLVLHHYPASPFSEKVRLAFGYKGLAWKSVLIPAVMPKPDLMPLTGGYRKTPVMQFGADVYCDTQLMMCELDRRYPDCPLLPAAGQASAEAMADWADHTLFLHGVAIAFQPAGMESFAAALTADELARFQQDRASFMDGLRPPSLAVAQARFAFWMDRLQQQLSDGGPWLFGEHPTVADFAVAHPLWFIVSREKLAHTLDPWPKVAEWLQAMTALGHGTEHRFGADEALALARESEPAPLPDGGSEDPGGLRPGDEVSVVATDYGRDPVVGELVYTSPERVIIRRTTPETGVVHVHFPRVGFALEVASGAG